MPGSGKTTLGHALAARFNLPFLDLDAEIVARASQVISAIFLEHGEAHFRQLEADTLREIVARPGPLVLATGGGTPCFHHNLTVLNDNGITLWLDVPVSLLTARLATAAETKSRPLLATSGPTEKWLHETLSTRKQFYEQARLRCAADDCTTDAVTAQLAAIGLVPG